MPTICATLRCNHEDGFVRTPKVSNVEQASYPLFFIVLSAAMNHQNVWLASSV